MLYLETYMKRRWQIWERGYLKEPNIQENRSPTLKVPSQCQGVLMFSSDSFNRKFYSVHLRDNSRYWF